MELEERIEARLSHLEEKLDGCVADIRKDIDSLFRNGPISRLNEKVSDIHSSVNVVSNTVGIIKGILGAIGVAILALISKVFFEWL